MLRITGGQFRGRMIHAPTHTQTRPTQAKLRQALFNSLQAVISNAKVLDLFAGSGALGLEALSWGAQSAVFVESMSKTSQLIKKNAELLQVVPQTTVLTESVGAVVPKLRPLGPFDLVFADPPYADGWELKLLNDFPWQELLNPSGRLCLEWGPQKAKLESLPDQVGFLVKIREKNYGDSVLTTYELKSES